MVVEVNSLELEPLHAANNDMFCLPFGGEQDINLFVAETNLTDEIQLHECYMDPLAATGVVARTSHAFVVAK